MRRNESAGHMPHCGPSRGGCWRLIAQVDCVQQKIAGYRREWARPPVAKLTGFATLCPPSEQLIRFHIMPQTTGLLVPGSLFLFSLGALADTTDPDREPLAILEVAGATSTSLTPGGSSFGPSVAVEVTPIENWLEIEIGVTPLFRRHHSAEWNTDVLFKNPWALSRHFEFMAGFGPEWLYSKEPGAKGHSIAGESVLNLMYWPGSKRRFGMFVIRRNRGPANRDQIAKGDVSTIRTDLHRAVVS